jgi:hypothetical protein
MGRALWVILLLGLASAAAAGPPVAAAKGKGTHGNGLAFKLKYKKGMGSVVFETNSFGSPSGSVDCYATFGRLAVLSGAIDAPVAGLTHFMLVVEDRKNLGGPDELATWLRNGAFDCEAEIADTDPDSLVNSRQPIERGKIVVVPIN